MKVIYTKEIGACKFVLETLETDRVVRVSGELIGKDADGILVHVSLDKLVKITD
jgi:hypothetical protein